MVQDLHSHTYYSFCGHDTPESIVEAAIAGGIDTFGICDHSYGVALQHKTTIYPDQERRAKHYQRAVKTYLDHMHLIRDRYSDKIRVLCGLEVATLDFPNWDLPDTVDISGFDYCLIESFGNRHSVITDLFAFSKRCGCPVTGLAHTDLFTYFQEADLDPLDFLTKMADHNIFWEMNVNFDSTHHFRTHLYMLDFFDSDYQQELVRKSGVKLSVGFDGHIVDDYKPEIVKDYCRKIQELDIPLVFSE